MAGDDLEGLEAVDRAEKRLEARSLARRRARERRERRRGWLPWLVRPVLLPLLGAGAVVTAIELAGGDLGGLAPGAAAGAMATGFLAPPALSAYLSRRSGVATAATWAVVTLSLELALVFGVAFVLLGLGPG